MGNQEFLTSRLVAFAALSFVSVTCAARNPTVRLPTPEAPELWYYHHTYLTSDKADESSRALIDKAAKAGYTGLALWDSSLDYLGKEDWPPENEDRMADVLRYATKKHLKVIAAPAVYGYSNEFFETNPNWAESQRVTGAEFVVDPSGKQLILKEKSNLLTDSGFVSQKQHWFDTNDSGIGISEAGHGDKSAAVVVDAPGNARFHQKFSVKPWHQYHVRLFFKSSKFRGGPMLSVFPGDSTERVLLNANLSANGDHDWAQLDYTFSSEENSRCQIYFGVWGGSSGTLWFDDVSVEETAFVYLIRRSGAPVKVYRTGNPSASLEEGRDVNTILDARMSDPKAFADDWHPVAPPTLPKTTRLKAGDAVSIDYYAAAPIPGFHSVSMCMTEPATFKWIERNAKAVNRVLPKEAGLFLGYDEIRQANSCGSCRAKNMTAGQLLAWSLNQTTGIYRKVSPNRPLYLWNDMFDPYHNAHANYYHVEGDLAGSWANMPPEIQIMNWNLDHLADSLKFFANLNHRQVIAGYYDSGDGAKTATTELEAARGVPGIQGLMYTTWADDYSQLSQFAAAAKANWKGYLQSLK